MRVRTVVASEILLLVGLLAVVAGAWLVERGFGLDAPLRLGTATTALVAGGPALLWLAYLHSQDRREAAPKHHVAATLLMGAFLAAPVAEWAIGQALVVHPAATPDLDPLALARLVRAVLVVAVAQELAKLAVVRYGVYRTADLDQPLDALVYATAVALGYAAYLTFRELRAGDGEVYLSVAVARSVSTALAHACFAAVSGYALGVAKFAVASPFGRALRLATGLGVAILLNGQFLVVSGVLAARDLEVTPWRVVAYGFGFAAVVFLCASILIRRLVALAPPAAAPSTPVPGAP
jgi:RsiW-degrading membrane proteinase PrsW (M82 family)